MTTVTSLSVGQRSSVLTAFKQDILDARSLQSMARVILALEETIACDRMNFTFLHQRRMWQERLFDENLSQ